jgi:hypothetical protein
MKLPHKSEPLQNNEPDLELPRGPIHGWISDSVPHRLHVDACHGNPAPASDLVVDPARVFEDVSDRVQVDAPLHLREGEPNHEGERRHGAGPKHGHQLLLEPGHVHDGEGKSTRARGGARAGVHVHAYDAARSGGSTTTSEMSDATAILTVNAFPPWVTVIYAVDLGSSPYP